MIVSLITAPVFAGKLEQKYQKIQKQIKERKKKIIKARKSEISFTRKIQQTNKRLYSIRKELKRQRRKVNRMSGRVALVKKEFGEFKKKIEKQRSYLKRKLLSMQRYGNDSSGILIALVASKSFSQMVRNMHYLRKIAEYDYNRIEIYKKNLILLHKKKISLDSLYLKLKTEEKKLQKDRDRLIAEKKQKERIFASIQGRRKLYEKMFRELTEASNKIRRMLRQKRSRTYKLTRFALSKGKLPWPIMGGRVTKRFGSYKDHEYKIPVFRRGIYIRVPEGTVARAVYSGRVVYADWFKGYGKVMIINHGSGYHSVYANLSEIFFRPGDTVKRGQAIGKVGKSGTVSFPALYFEIRYRGKPLNPRQWLARNR